MGKDPWRRAYHCRLCGAHVQEFDCGRLMGSRDGRCYQVTPGVLYCPTPGCPGTSVADFVMIRRSGCPICDQKGGPGG